MSKLEKSSKSSIHSKDEKYITADEDRDYSDKHPLSMPPSEAKAERSVSTLQRKALMLEQELDAETDEEFERYKVLTPVAVAAPKPSGRDEERANKIRKGFKM
jgi:hypothetical protein